jgi:hypothetical protein
MNGGPQTPGRPVGLPPAVQRPAVPIRAEYSPAARLTVYLLRPAWLWRRELSCLLLLTVMAGWVWAGHGRWAALAAVVGLIAVCLAVPVLRRRVGRWLSGGRLRRRWDAACRFAELATINDRIPRITKVRWVPAGERLRVRIPKGGTAEDLADVAERIAVVLRVREVRVARDVDRAHRAHVEVVRRDPFLASGNAPDGGLVAWPWAGREQVSLWGPFPIGIDEIGDVVWMTLVGRNVLLGGEPGAGKSSALSVLIAAAALDPSVRIWGLDAKRLELALWRPVLDRFVGNDIDAAIEAMTDLQTIMDDRYAALEVTGRRKVSPADGPLYLFAIDELRFFTAHSDRKKRQVFNDLAIDLAARGRAAGIILAAATQKPSTDVVPSSLRDLLAYRWAMRCTTKDASDTILGAGWATAGFSAATIDTRTPGVGLLLAEGDTPRKVRSAYLSDEEIRIIAARGKALRDHDATVQTTVVRAAERSHEPLRAGSRQASTATQRHPSSHQQDNR